MVTDLASWEKRSKLRNRCGLPVICIIANGTKDFYLEMCFRVFAKRPCTYTQSLVGSFQQVPVNQEDDVFVQNKFQRFSIQTWFILPSQLLTKWGKWRHVYIKCLHGNALRDVSKKHLTTSLNILGQIRKLRAKITFLDSEIAFFIENIAYVPGNKCPNFRRLVGKVYISGGS